MLILAFTVAAAWLQTVPSQDAALIILARDAVQAEVLGTAFPKSYSHSAVHPVFVTIERNGKVLGCRGDLTPRSSSLEDEVVLAARSAAKHDPRHLPLQPQDLRNYLVTVTVISRMDRIPNVDALQPFDGLVLESGSKKGIVLPWEGKDPDVRLHWAYQKAGVPMGSAAALFRLIATRCRG